MPSVVARARSNLAASWRRSVAYGVLYALVGGFLLAPFFSWLQGRALALSGTEVATNFDIASTVLSVPGLLALLAWSLGAALIVLLGLGGHVVLSADAVHGRPRAPSSAFLASLRAAPRLLRPAVAWVAIYGLVLLPVLVTATSTLKAAAVGSTENLYLQIVPDSLVGAAAFYVALTLAIVFCYVILVRWTFLIHALLIEDLPLGAAMRRSAALVRSRRAFVIKTLLGLHLGILVFIAVETLLFSALVWLGLDVIAGDAVGVSLVVAALLLVLSAALAAITSSLIGAATASTITALYLELGGTIEPVEGVREALRVPLPRTARGLLVGIGALLALGLLLVWPRLEEAFTYEFGQVTVTGHRGSSSAAPENTVAAIKLALEQGADYCEIDVLEAKDGAVVVIHDTNLRRLAGRDENVYELTGAELAQIDVGRWKGASFVGETVPLLRDVMALVKGRMKLNIELKTHGHERGFPESVVALIHELEFGTHCVITSLDMGMLRRVRAKDPSLRLGAIVTASFGDVHALDVDFYSVERAGATTAFIRRSHAIGRDVHVWTTNEASTITEMLDRGVDSLITDFPARARGIVDGRSAGDEAHASLMRLFER